LNRRYNNKKFAYLYLLINKTATRFKDATWACLSKHGDFTYIDASKRVKSTGFTYGLDMKEDKEALA
jgi:hypothetical protein